jgi:Tfp pilus assembly protein PilO
LPRTRTLGIFLVVLLVIGLAYFGLGYRSERNGQKALITKMDDTNKMLSLIAVPPADLQQRLTDAQNANLAAKQNLLPTDVDTTQVIKSVLAVADESNVTVIPLNTDSWTNIAIEGTNYRVLTISLSVDGSFTDLASFINRFYGSDFPSLIVDTVSIHPSVQSAGGAGGISGDYTGVIQLGIYTQAVK